MILVLKLVRDYVVFVGTLLADNEVPSRSPSKLTILSTMLPRPFFLQGSQRVFLSSRTFTLFEDSDLLDCTDVLLWQLGHSKKIFMRSPSLS